MGKDCYNTNFELKKLNFWQEIKAHIFSQKIFKPKGG